VGKKAHEVGMSETQPNVQKEKKAQPN